MKSFVLQFSDYQSMISNLMGRKRITMVFEGNYVKIHDICDLLLLSNKSGGWNKRGGGAKVAVSINLEVGILQLESSPFVFK